MSLQTHKPLNKTTTFIRIQTGHSVICQSHIDSTIDRFIMLIDLISSVRPVSDGVRCGNARTMPVMP